MIKGVCMIVIGLAMAAADKKLERRFTDGHTLTLLWELAAFLLVIGGLVAL